MATPTPRGTGRAFANFMLRTAPGNEPDFAPTTVVDPVESAHAAGLRYVSDSGPGIRRRKAGTGFYYISPGGARITDSATLKRIRSLVIPPAWTDVWICPDPRGHLQATGFDSRRRKQYRYHPRWRETRDAEKYDRMAAFAQALPSIRERTDRDLNLPGMPRQKVLATVVKLLENTLVRIGNDEYRRENGSFGLTTFRNQHAQVIGSRALFRFRGKAGKKHNVEINNRRLARVVRKCQEIPGQELFQYIADDGTPVPIESGDVNQYLKEISGGDFTAKDFRTWAGSVLAAESLVDLEPATSERQRKQQLASVVDQVALQLGNTPTVCRKCYVHPVVIDSFMAGTIQQALQTNGHRAREQSLSDGEQLFVQLLTSQPVARAA